MSTTVIGNPPVVTKSKVTYTMPTVPDGYGRIDGVRMRPSNTELDILLTAIQYITPTPPAAVSTQFKSFNPLKKYILGET